MIVASQVRINQTDVVNLGITSKLNSTPPIGEPKATDIPDAAAAERTSLLRARTSSTYISSNSEADTHLHSC